MVRIFKGLTVSQHVLVDYSPLTLCNVSSRLSQSQFYPMLTHSTLLIVSFFRHYCSTCLARSTTTLLTILYYFFGFHMTFEIHIETPIKFELHFGWLFESSALNKTRGSNRDLWLTILY